MNEPCREFDLQLSFKLISSLFLADLSTDCFLAQITSYDGIMRYKVSHEMSPGGELTTDTDVQITVSSLFA